MKLHCYFSSSGVTQSDLARNLGISPVLVNQWSNEVRQVPAERCPDIEAATGGAVTCEELRPDVNWAVVRSAPVSAEASVS